MVKYINESIDKCDRYKVRLNNKYIEVLLYSEDNKLYKENIIDINYYIDSVLEDSRVLDDYYNSIDNDYTWTFNTYDYLDNNYVKDLLLSSNISCDPNEDDIYLVSESNFNSMIEDIISLLSENCDDIINKELYDLSISD